MPELRRPPSRPARLRLAPIVLAVALLGAGAPAAALPTEAAGTRVPAVAAVPDAVTVDGSRATAATGSGDVGLAAAADAPAWTWPLARPLRIVAPFRAPAHPYGPGHRGLDLGAAAGSTVLAPAAGAVSFSGMVAGRPVLSIDHGGGVISSMEPVSGTLGAGARVAPGQAIGTVAEGGHCTGCVHLGVRVDGVYVSPFRFLGGLPRAVLLPLGGPPGGDAARGPSP